MFEEVNLMTTTVEVERSDQDHLRPGWTASPPAPSRPAPLPERWDDIPDHLPPDLLPPSPAVEHDQAEARRRRPLGGVRVIERPQVPVLDRARLGIAALALCAAMAVGAGALSAGDRPDPSPPAVAPVASAVDATPAGDLPATTTGCSANAAVSEILRLSAPRCSGAIR